MSAYVIRRLLLMIPVMLGVSIVVFLVIHLAQGAPAVILLAPTASEEDIQQIRRELGLDQPIHVQWTELDAAAWEREIQSGRGTIGPFVRRRLPDRLADMLLAEAGVPPDRPLGQLRREERRRLLGALTRYPLPWTGDEGYKKAEVTGGGVALDEVDPRTLESRLHRGLFLCGEILDAFGPIGGYNFLWAWCTGRAAGQGAAAALGRAPGS